MPAMPRRSARRSPDQACASSRSSRSSKQAALALHRTRDLLVRQRTQLVNMIRGLLAEFGIAIPKGITNALAFVRRAAAREANEVPDLATKVIGALAEQAIEVQGRIRQLERDLLASFRSNDLARRIA